MIDHTWKDKSRYDYQEKYYNYIITYYYTK